MEYINASECSFTIPPKANPKDPWECDFYAHCERHLIENFFNQLKEYRRIATRFDKMSYVFLASIYIGSILILLK